MRLTSLLYISTSTMVAMNADGEARAIAAQAVVKNSTRKVSGALLFTGKHFAQVLEGAEDQIDLLMAKISADSRHENVIVVDRSPTDIRRFGDWNMAYLGPSQFVQRHISQLINAPTSSERLRTTAWLGDLLHEFSKR